MGQGERVLREILPYIAAGVRQALSGIDPMLLDSLEEIRLRAEKPLMLHRSKKDWFVGERGLSDKPGKGSYLVRQAEILKSVELMSENSIYAYQDEIRNGFITLKGGHRVGIAGRAIVEGKSIKNIRDISGLNIRVSREVPGCGEKLLKHIIKAPDEVYNTLIVSPPQCGKTTMLRDLARLLSDGYEPLGFSGVKVGIIDERSEIAACYRGVPQNDVGLRSDVLDSCPKILGMDIMLRSMSPNIIVTDEIGGEGDGDAVMRVINAGVKIITTAHGYNISELKSRREVLKLIEEGVFDRYIVLSNEKGPGTIKEVVEGRTLSLLK